MRRAQPISGMLARHYVRLALVIAVLIPSTLFAAGIHEVHLSRQEGITNEIASELLKAAYAKIGFEVQSLVLPAERSLQEVNAGKFDGEVARVKGLSAEYADLVMVPTPLMTVEGTVFIRQGEAPITAWGDLAGRTIAFRRGLKFAERETVGMNPVLTASDTQAFQMLAAGRVDVVVSGRWDGQMAIRHLGLSGIHAAQRPLIQVPLYHYLHRSRADLVPLLDKAIRELGESGQAEAIIAGFWE